MNDTSARSALILLVLWTVAGCSSSSDDHGAASVDAGPANDAATAIDGGLTTDGGGDATRDGRAGDSAGADGEAGSTTSSVPTNPISFPRNTPFTVDSGTTNYVFVPNSYDGTHMTPITLFVWLHGCGGMSSGDIYTVSPGGTSQSWISLAVGGQEGNCWDMTRDPPRVLAAIANIKTHFNIKPKGVILGGYSSGGDLTYRTAFYNAGLFAGVLVENTSPYRDTGSTQAASLAAASWKFNVVHLAHLQDTTYAIAGVRAETNSLTAAGFPMMRIEVDGGHYDAPGAIENGHAVPGTSADVATYLFPLLSAGWTSP